MTAKRFQLISLTYAAKVELSRLIHMRNVRDPVFTIARATVQGTGNVKWGVGTYKREDLHTNVEVTNIEGFDFFFDPSIETELGQLGAVLDFRDGAFRINQTA